MVSSMPLLLVFLVVYSGICILLVMESGSSGFELAKSNYVYENGWDKTPFLFGIF